MPVDSTKAMPSSTSRSEVRGRAVRPWMAGRRGGISGSTRTHSSSLIRRDGGGSAGDDMPRSLRRFPRPDQSPETHFRNVFLAGVAQRLRAERGVDDPWRLTVGWGALWAEYGDLRLRVAGEGAEPRAPDDLFDEIDSWVAFDRIAGPGQVLARDRQAMAEWRQRIPAVQQFWERVARRVFRDVEATTDLRLPWKVVVHEDEPDWSAIHADLMDGVDGGIDAVGGIVLMDKPMPQPGRRPLNFPQIWLETPRTGRSLPEMADEAEATGYLADLVQEDIIEEVHGAWPECPRHPHPLRSEERRVGK